MPSASTGASASMPSTAVPSASRSSRSSSSGCRVDSARARARTSSVSSSSRHGGRPEPGVGDLERALVDDLEVADLLDRVAPELEAHRVLLGGREHVEDAAAHGELAALVDQVGPRVRRTREPTDEVVHGDLVALPHGHRLEVAEAADDRLEHGADRRDDDAYGAVLGVAPGGRDGAARRADGRRCRSTGESRSCGSVSQAGNSATVCSAIRSARAAVRSSASRAVAVTRSSGRSPAAATAAATSG